MQRGKKMNEKGDKTMIYIGDNLPNHDHLEENKNPWVVLDVGDFYIVARNGADGTPEMFNRQYDDWHDAQERADWMNDKDGIQDAPRFDG